MVGAFNVRSLDAELIDGRFQGLLGICDGQSESIPELNSNPARFEAGLSLPNDPTRVHGALGRLLFGEQNDLNLLGFLHRAPLHAARNAAPTRNGTMNRTIERMRISVSSSNPRAPRAVPESRSELSECQQCAHSVFAPHPPQCGWDQKPPRLRNFLEWIHARREMHI